MLKCELAICLYSATLRINICTVFNGSQSLFDSINDCFYCGHFAAIVKMQTNRKNIVQLSGTSHLKSTIFRASVCEVGKECILSPFQCVIICCVSIYVCVYT